MCGPTEALAIETTQRQQTTIPALNKMENAALPLEQLLDPPTLLARYSCAGLMVAAFGVWGKYSFVQESEAPGIGSPMHSYMAPLVLTTSYILCLPLLRLFSSHYLSKVVDVKLLLKETMVIYNAGQVLLNGWMVYRYIDAVLLRGHPFIGDMHTVNTGATFAVWIHYCDKYLEFFDTFFMVLRGRMDQVRKVLHVSHSAVFSFRCGPIVRSHPT
jgi:elongation of very long chain fatty acids protein 4